MIETLSEIYADQVQTLEELNLASAVDAVKFCHNLEYLTYEELLNMAKVLALSLAISSEGEEPCFNPMPIS